ncbi:unnamed protein product [Amaranthus hypochondriacus]
MDTLPNALITEILLKLPVKSLLTLKCVSKSLNSLISNHEFINIHLNHIKSCSKKKILIQTIDSFEYIHLFDLSDSLQGPHFNISPWHSNMLEIVLPETSLSLSNFCWPSTRRKFYRLMGSCNGLLCVIYQDTKDDCYYIEFVVFNPCIRNYKEISLYVDKLLVICSDAYGFGFDHINNDYKIILLINTNRHDRPHTESNWSFQIFIYSFNSGLWRNMYDIPFDNDMFICSTKIVDINNQFYLLFEKKDKVARTTIFVIGCFNMSNEKWCEYKVPNSINHPTLQVLDGCLCIMNDNIKNGIEFWVMKEYGVWTMLLSVMDQNIKNEYGFQNRRYSYFVNPIGFTYSNQKLGLHDKNLFLLWDRWTSQFVLYDIRDKTVKRVQIEVITPTYVNIFHDSNVYLYEETLVSISGKSQRTTTNCKVIELKLRDEQHKFIFIFNTIKLALFWDRTT